MADWLRLWHGTVTDTKFLWVARRSGARFGDVMAVWLALLEEASQADDRGDVSGFDAESFDCLLGADDGETLRIMQAMSAKGLVGEDMRLAGWERRQPEREDLGNPATGAMSAAERKRLQRQRQKQGNVTQCHDESRTVTQCHDRGEEKRGEEINPSDKERGKADREVEPNPESLAHQVTDAGSACLQMRAAGIQGVNPSHPKLLALLAAGITPNEIGEVAREERAKGKGMAWVLAVAEGRRREAANVAALPRGSPPGRRQPQTLSEQRSAAGKAIFAPGPVGANDGHERRTIDVTPAATDGLGAKALR